MFFSNFGPSATINEQLQELPEGKTTVFQVKISSTINSGGNVRWAIQISLLVL